MFNNFWYWLKKQLKIISINTLGFLPIIIFMDMVMNIIVSRDYGIWVTAGFVSCVVLYATIYAKYVYGK